ncbi:B3 DNA binding domain-containing protein [Artemisia annua]|uniref:B3 DNA binding domain-containing protein n=1 Tax=Artemisia annua TaxID=35608 RepID=A0A2U1QLI9_ARTAN|nr:B3 DNA binding domain-containing protein [Artemisia annua]
MAIGPQSKPTDTSPVSALDVKKKALEIKKNIAHKQTTNPKPKNISYDPKTIALAQPLNSQSKSSPIERANEVEAGCLVLLSLCSHHMLLVTFAWLPKNFCDAHLPKDDVTVVLVDEDDQEFNTKYLDRKTGLSGGKLVKLFPSKYNHSRPDKPPMLSGTSNKLFPAKFRSFRLDKPPMLSGTSNNLFPAKFRSFRLDKPPMLSGTSNKLFLAKFSFFRLDKPPMLSGTSNKLFLAKLSFRLDKPPMLSGTSNKLFSAIMHVMDNRYAGRVHEIFCLSSSVGAFMSSEIKVPRRVRLRDLGSCVLAGSLAVA